MNRRCPARRLAAPLLGLSLILAASCLPRTGQVTVHGEDGAGLADRGGGSDHKILIADTGPLPDGQPPKKDTVAPPKPDTSVTPSGPQPPFGTSVGMTVKNVTGVPDCAGKTYDLYSFYGQKKGVLIAMMSPS